MYLERQEHFLPVEKVTGGHPQAAAPQVHGEDLGVALGEGFPGPGDLAGHDLVAHVHQYGVHAGEY